MSDQQTETETETRSRRGCWRVSRRGFLIGAGTVGVVAAGGLYFGLPIVRLKAADMFDGDGGASFAGIEGDPPTWFEITPDNVVRFHTPKVEMGQGIHTALKQMVAEELGVAWEQIVVVPAATQRGPVDGFGTGGSASVQSAWQPLREAAATMREMLREKAAEKLTVSAASLIVAGGVFTSGDKSLTFGEIVEGVTEWVVPEEAPALKPASQFEFIGQSLPRVDFEAKLRGEAIYGYDARMPGMLYGAVARPPTIEGTMQSAAPGDAPDQPGVVEVVIEDDFAGVVANNRYQADIARNKLDVTWDEGKLWQQAELDEIVTVGNGKPTVIQKVGDSKMANEADNAVIAEYRSPMAAHAHLEPQAAVVEFRDDGITAIVSTQFPTSARDALAEEFGLEPGQVDVKSTYIGGGFGRKLNAAGAIEAAKLSKAVGRPVHVGWNRREEFRNGYLRPSTHHILKAKLADDGLIEGIEHQQASGDVAYPFLPGFFPLVAGADFGAWRGGRIQYGGIPNIRTVAWRTPMPLPTGWWRGLGLLCNTFAIESFIDECAAQTGYDPVEYRLKMLSGADRDQRLLRVLEAAAQAANWGGTLPAGHAHGVGLSIDVGTPCAQIAEVSVEDGQIRVHKVTCVIDPGIAINPDGVIAQTQGSIIMGLGSTFFEKITVKDGRIEASNFNKYPLITMKEAPEIEVVILETADAPRGMGEPPMGPPAAAVGNAVFALTGTRLRELPLQL